MSAESTTSRISSGRLCFHYEPRSYPTDIDIFVRKSTDNGITWSDEENVTDTPMGVISGNDATYYLETGMHLAQKSTENEISIFFQMPDLENLNNPPG